ncbi:MAG: putative repeat protein (TIGR03806 family) [Myxococcota bacterium]|jgi:uncharacterized repeat protein (TIGR03806 family)
MIVWILLACADPKPDTSTDTDTTVEDTAVEDTEWGDVSFDPDEWPPELLSELNLIRWDGSDVSYNVGIVPYSLRTPLFSDYALKERAIWTPPGEAADFVESGVLDFPVGTVILKSFIVADDLRTPEVGRHLIETRLLIRGSEGWAAWPYLWRENGSEADRHVSGAVMAMDFIDPEGEARTAQYLVPQRNQCTDCHEQYDDDGERYLAPIGPSARNLNGPSPDIDGAPNQLQHLADEGMLVGLPALEGVDQAADWAAIEAAGVDSLSEAEVAVAARDYLDSNCAHCHSPRGIEGVTSQFFMNHDNTDEFHLGICKRPGSAGEGGVDREFDIVPGDPKQSILWYRTDTEDVGAMMPDIGRSLKHTPASALLWRWIAEMEPRDCE